MRKALLLLLGLLLIGILAYFCFMDKSTDIKNDLISKTEAVYKDNGLKGIKVGIKGEDLKQTRIITLNGEVASENIKNKAGDIASQINGVMGVENDLIVNSSVALVDISNNFSNNGSKTVEVDIKDENIENSTLNNRKNIVEIEKNVSIKDSENKDKISMNEEDKDSILNKEVENNITTSPIADKGVKNNITTVDNNIEVNTTTEKDAIKIEENNSTEVSIKEEKTDLIREERDKNSISDKETDSNTTLDTNIVDNTKKDVTKAEENDSKEVETKETKDLDIIIDKDKLVQSAIAMNNIDNNLSNKNKSLVDSAKERDNETNNSFNKNKDISKKEKKNSKIKLDISKCQSKFKKLLGGNKIHFAYNRATIRHKSYPLLNKLIKAIKSCPNEVIIIEGHTDSDGNEAYNQRLSEKRANAVKRYLIKHGVSASRLEAIGYGEKRPIADNRTKEGKEKNRRIEFKIKGVK